MTYKCNILDYPQNSGIMFGMQTIEKPVTIRMPRSGQKCPYTGLSRSSLYKLTTPSQENGNCLPVKSFCLRNRGSLRGVRLISFESLCNYLNQQMKGDLK
jgi:hypothetical protein